MNKEKQKIVPVLRFPEFENDENWKNEPLGKFADVSKLAGYEFTKHIVYEDEGKIIALRGLNIKNNKLDLKDVKYIDNSELSKLSRSKLFIDDLMFTYIGTIGEVALIEENDKYYLAPNVSRIRLNKEKVIPNFILQYFNTTNFKKVEVAKYISSSSQPALTMGNVRKFSINLPPSKEEQQKIANCLSSLDNLITAETEKLDCLKDHKKGLLQQLFPAKGETKPQFRFSEFKNEGDWEETILDDVADYANGKAHEKEISETGKYKVVNSKFISTDGRVVKFTDSANLKANIGDVLMVLSDIPNGKAIAKCFYVDKEDTYTVNQRICKITPTDINNKFLFYIQNRNKYFLAFDDGVKQTNLRKDTVLSFPFLKPKNPKEQQKIANCLSSADDLIQAQKTKIKNLKDHKKGLMQQLFPNVNEVAK